MAFAPCQLAPPSVEVCHWASAAALGRAELAGKVASMTIDWFAGATETMLG